MSASAIYAGAVRHRRHEAQPGAFRHAVSYLYVDLEELPRLIGGRLVRRGPGLVRVRARDLLGDAAAIRSLVEDRTGRPAPDGPIRVLTTPRVLGMCFNPASFYFLFDRAEQLGAVIVEVTSTPWLKRHAYVATGGGRVLHGDDAKVHHVSPFQHMDHRHVWSVAAPGETLSVHIANARADTGDTDFDATLKLERRPLTRSALRRLAFNPPALRTLALIYGHAAVLKLRGATYFSPPAPTTDTALTS